MLIRHYHYPANSPMDSHDTGINRTFSMSYSVWSVLQPYPAPCLSSLPLPILAVTLVFLLFLQMSTCSYLAISHLKCSRFQMVAWLIHAMAWHHLAFQQHHLFRKASLASLNVSPIVFTLLYFFFILYPLDSIGYMMICLLHLWGKIPTSNDFRFCFPTLSPRAYRVLVHCA